MPLTFARYTDEIAAQGELLASTVAGADHALAVPSCPDWDLGTLLRHVGGVQQWATEIVETRATAEVPRTPGDPGVRETSAALADALRAAGPGVPLWTPLSDGVTDFYARRFTHETALHRADAALAVGASYALDPAVAVDGVDEWLELGSLPFHFEVHPWMRELLGPGRTVHLHATDTPDAEWVVDLTGEAITWRRAHEKAAVAVRAPVVDLLLLIYRRRAPTGLEVLGDSGLLDFWLERVSFG